MADEAATAAAVVATGLTPLIEISYGLGKLTSLEVIRKINECVSYNKQIELIMDFPARDDFDVDDDENYERLRFNATADMQNAALENSMPIKRVLFFNNCSEKEEQIKCFTFFTKIAQGIIGNAKHIIYVNNKWYNSEYEFEFELEQANQLANALRSNNNNNNDIEIFHFTDPQLNHVTLQPLLDALLAIDVRKIIFGNRDTADFPINNKNNHIDFSGMHTNTSLKELDLSLYKMREKDLRSLFHSIKKNKGLEKLKFHYRNYECLPTRLKRLFEEMMCENITLLNCCLHAFPTPHEGIFEVIQGHMELNRMWKRYIMKREREKKTPAVITKIEERDNNNNKEEERKKEEPPPPKEEKKKLFGMF